MQFPVLGYRLNLNLNNSGSMNSLDIHSPIHKLLLKKNIYW